MKLTKLKSDYGLNIFIGDNEKYLGFTFGGNGDLYWVIHSYVNDFSFKITKENYGVYELFQKLYNDIENINIFDENYIPFFINTEEEKNKYRIDFLKYIEEQKEKYRLFNCSNYNNLFNKENNTITWYSDETNEKVANYLTITKEEDKFILKFYIQPFVLGYQEDFHSNGYIPIRFCNSGSRYEPFNVLFMKMYNNLKNIDDVNDINHQIHVEEYLYNNLKLTKK